MTAAWETRGVVDGADRDAHDLARFGYGAAKAPAALLAITQESGHEPRLIAAGSS